jgi:GMP synthase (glutamine-hydrolysing)
VENEAFRFDGKPIYCTQFHPELDREGIITRIAQYPAYLSLAGHDTLAEFSAATPETPETEAILRRFVSVALPGES